MIPDEENFVVVTC